MSDKKLRQGGYVWLVLILVIFVVLAIVWSNKKTTTDDSTATSTAQITDETKKDTSVPITKTVGTKSTTINTQPVITSSGAYLISYTSNGFIPPVVNVPIGKSVHIVNNSNNALLVMPVDLVNKPYVDFKQSKSVGRGGVFDYTFTSVGSYAYFNANSKTHTGVVTVR
ncbi:MAG TPA: hypothetical protein VJK09_02595 [Candidatus Paceibacterota bacterium]